MYSTLALAKLMSSLSTYKTNDISILDYVISKAYYHVFIIVVYQYIWSSHNL